MRKRDARVYEGEDIHSNSVDLSICRSADHTGLTIAVKSLSQDPSSAPTRDEMERFEWWPRPRRGECGPIAIEVESSCTELI